MTGAQRVRVRPHPHRRVRAGLWCLNMSLSVSLLTLPVALCGISPTNTMSSGTANLARRGTRYLYSSSLTRSWYSASASCPGLSTTTSSGRSPQRSSLMATTAASATCGCPMARFSISMDEIHSPPLLITSLDLSVICMWPSLSMDATSPVANHPSPSTARLSVLRYCATTAGPRTCRWPTALPSCGRTRPSSSTMRISHSTCGRPCFSLAAVRSPSGRASSGALVPPSVPSGVSSVMPHRWRTSTPWVRSNASIMERGAAAPPMTAMRKVSNPLRP
mmetsp:Transcript_23311/g.59610  ORF Transcript_23311/g.59610 Transcript_23311/m.59610 type:complete len:277 (+) Transcript_23311:420-1250(+)